MMQLPFVIEERVRWSDVDAAGIICYGAYTRFLEAAETELFRAAGLPYGTVFQTLDVWLPRAHMSLDFARPAYLDDLLEVGTGVSRLGRTSITLRFEARRKGEATIVMQGRLVLASVSRETLRPVALPQRLIEALTPFRIPSPRPASPRDAILHDLDLFLSARPDPEAAMEVAVDLLHARLDHFHWTGIYLLEDQTLVLGPFRGAPTEHRRIAVGRGVCGAAVAEKRNRRVDDVTKLDNYLSCSPETRSELVVLIRRGESILGQIDVDSDLPAAFSSEDEVLVEAVAQRLARLLPKPGVSLG